MIFKRNTVTFRLACLLPQRMGFSVEAVRVGTNTTDFCAVVWHRPQL